MDEFEFRCENCDCALGRDRVVWLELNCLTLKWAPVGRTVWTGTAESQGIFPFGKDCATKVLKQGLSRSA